MPNEDPDQDGTLTQVNLRYPGQYYDQGSGLHYNWNRYYDPRTGRYITSDPIGLEGGLNTYAYASNDPLRWVDPDGLFVRTAPIELLFKAGPKPPGPEPIVPVAPNPGLEPAPGAQPNPPAANPDDRRWRRRPGRWTVYVRCNVTKFQQTSECNCPPPKTIGGWAYGNTFADAFANAQHDANQNLGDLGKRACYPRHCQPVSCFENGRKVSCPKSGR